MQITYLIKIFSRRLFRVKSINLYIKYLKEFINDKINFFGDQRRN